MKDDGGTIGGAGLGVTDIQEAGINLLQRANDVLVPGLIAAAAAGFPVLDCAAADPVLMNWAAAMEPAAMPKKRRR